MYVHISYWNWGYSIAMSVYQRVFLLSWCGIANNFQPSGVDSFKKGSARSWNLKKKLAICFFLAPVFEGHIMNPETSQERMKELEFVFLKVFFVRSSLEFVNSSPLTLTTGIHRGYRQNMLLSGNLKVGIWIIDFDYFGIALKDFCLTCKISIVC